MFNRSNNTNSTLAFNTSANAATSVTFAQLSNVSTRFYTLRSGSSGWSGDFITSDYYGIDDAGAGAPYGEGIYEGIRHFNK